MRAQPATFNFDAGLPAGTVFYTNNPGSGVTNAGGYNNSGCLILTRPASGQTFSQWVITNDLAGGVPVSSFNVSFKLYMGHGTNGNSGVPNSGGNGLVFHLGPQPPIQYTGSASSWSNGLDVTFRTYSTPPNTAGLNVEYNPVSGTFNPGNGSIIATTGFLGFYQTNGPADSFAEAVDVSLALANGMLNVACSNALIGNVIVYTNLAIPGFAPITPGTITFSATDGAGAHEDAWIDNVSISLNANQPTGAVVFVQQPVNQTTRPSEAVTFTSLATGALPLSYQWFSNSVAIAGATTANYTTPSAGSGMNGTVYSVTGSNNFGVVPGGNATLKVLPALGRTLVWSDEFNGTTLDTTKWQPQNYLRTPQFTPPGYWVSSDAYLNGFGQLVLRVEYNPSTGRYGSGAVQGLYQRTFGYFEAKVKFPTQQGHWCAFWLFTMSQGSTNVIGGSDGDEMDIMEKAWLTDHIQHALHWDGYSGPLAGSAGLQVTNLGLNDGGWHIFGLNWTPTNYAFYVDGARTWLTSTGGVSQVPEYMMLTDEIGNYGTGSNAWGTGSITNANLPDYYLVEYARVYEAAPYITNQPASQTVGVGGSASFSVGAVGTPPLTYQWQFNGTNISGATTNPFTRGSVQSSDAGNYSVVVSDLAEAATSAVAILTVVPKQAMCSPLLLGSNLGVWGTNSDGTINDPFMSNAAIRSKAGAALNLMRFPCRSFTSSQLQSIAGTIRSAGLEPLAILTSKNQTNALAQVNALSSLVAYFEFGNENNYADGWSGATYASHWASDIPVLKAAAPNAKFGGPVGSDYTASGSTYLRDFLNGINGAAGIAPDFISMHYYSGHGEIPAWNSSKILTDVGTDMLPGIDTMKADIASITGSSIPLAISEWNYDAVPENNTNNLDTDATFMHNYTFKVLDGFNARGVWASCQYDFAAGAGGGHLDMVSTSGSAKPQYNEFLNWKNQHTNPPPVLGSPVLTNGQLTLSWTGGGVLQTSTNLAGPWSTITPAASPYTLTPSPSVPRQFWRAVILP
jgi:beta-glucanase (GH16 family)